MATLPQDAWHGKIFFPSLLSVLDPMGNSYSLTFTAYAQPTGSNLVVKFSYKKTLTPADYTAFVYNNPKMTLDLSSFFTQFIAPKMAGLLVDPASKTTTVEEMMKEVKS